MRIKQMIMHSNLSKMKDKFSQPVFNKNYRDSLGEFSNKRRVWGWEGLSAVR